jgi:hypothetical protein
MLADVNWLAWKIVLVHAAYAYNRGGCMIWEGDLLNLCQLSHGGKIGLDIYLRLAAAEYQNTKGEMKSILIYAIFLFELILH